MMNRRSLITGLISLVAAPAIVKVANIMPVKTMLVDHHGFKDGVYYGYTRVSYGSFNAEDTERFYNRLKLYMDEVMPIGVDGEREWFIFKKD